MNFSKRIVYTFDVDHVRADAVTYKTDRADRLQMTVYSQQSEQLRPAVLFIHGGPIPSTMVSPTEWGIFKSYGELAAMTGMVGVTFNHRLFGLQDFERSKADIFAALNYVREHASEWAIDSGRIAVWMCSGGGAHLGWILREPPAGIRCAVAFYPVLDFRPYLPSDAAEHVVRELERWSAATVSPDQLSSLPLLLVRAGLDAAQINQGTDQFISAAIAANAPLELINYAAGHHTFDAVDDNDESRAIIQCAVQFLRRRLS